MNIFTRKKVDRLLEEIDLDARYTATFTGIERFSDRVMSALEQTPRDKFVSGEYKDVAYYNRPLPIDYGQTISQPYIVALMTDLLELTRESSVLEVGTGSGYQTAILSQLAKNVYSLERIKELCEPSLTRLRKLGYKNIEIRCSDDYNCWRDQSPFNAIIVTAAISHIPQTLIEQLTPGGRMVIPVGLAGMHQELMLVRKSKEGTLKTESILGVSFVPLITTNNSDRENSLKNMH